MRLSSPVSMRALAIGLAVLSLSHAAWSAAPQRDRTTSERPNIIVEFSRQMSELRKATKGVAIRILHKGGYSRGLYLGKGLVATPAVPDLERGSSASLASSRGLFRLRVLGSVGRSPESKPLVTFYKLRDPFDEFEPANGRHADRGWRERAGDMVLIRDRYRSTIGFVRLSFGMNKAGKWSMDAKGPNDDTYMHMLDADVLDPGAVVFNAKGHIVGMAVEMERPRRRRGRRGAERGRQKPGADGAKSSGSERVRERGGKSSTSKREDKRSERPEPMRKTYVTMDIHWMLARGEHELENKLPPPEAPSVGVNIEQVSGKRAEGGKFVVTRVMMATPAHGAGARRGDRWIAINGKPLEGFQQIKDAIRSRREMTISYRRQGVSGVYKIQPR